MVSNQFEQFKVENDQISPLTAGCVHPPSLAEELAELRVLPSEIDATAILPFVPAASQIEIAAGGENRLGKLQHLLAWQTATIHAVVATHLLEEYRMGLHRGLLRRNRPLRPRVHGVSSAEDGSGLLQADFDVLSTLHGRHLPVSRYVAGTIC